ncbi:unnamed protein product [Effrenium voratum]|nr:unnamed protein product [Effrenium voratum]
MRRHVQLWVALLYAAAGQQGDILDASPAAATDEPTSFSKGRMEHVETDLAELSIPSQPQADIETNPSLDPEAPGPQATAHEAEAPAPPINAAQQAEAPAEAPAAPVSVHEAETPAPPSINAPQQAEAPAPPIPAHEAEALAQAPAPPPINAPQQAQTPAEAPAAPVTAHEAETPAPPHINTPEQAEAPATPINAAQQAEAPAEAPRAPAPPPINAPPEVPSALLHGVSPLQMVDGDDGEVLGSDEAVRDRQAWYSLGQKFESKADLQKRLAMEDEVRMESLHWAEAWEHQQQSIHHDPWAYYEGDLSRQQHRQVLGLQSSLAIMCFSPLLAGGAGMKLGGGCRAAWLGEWGAEAGHSNPAIKDGANSSHLLPPLPWGQAFPFLEQTSVGDHLELARVGDDRFMVCFEISPTMLVSCRIGFVHGNSSISYGAALDDAPARLVSVSASGQGTEFAVCSQGLSLNSKASEVSCRWGQISAAQNSMQWAKEAAISFAWDTGR